LLLDAAQDLSAKARWPQTNDRITNGKPALAG